MFKNVLMEQENAFLMSFGSIWEERILHPSDIK